MNDDFGLCVVCYTVQDMPVHLVWAVISADPSAITQFSKGK